MKLPRVAVTTAGRSAVALAVLGWVLGQALHWTELLYLGAVSTALVLLGLVSVLVPHRATAHVAARPSRTTVGRTIHGVLAVQGGIVPMASPVVHLRGEVAPQTVRLQVLLPGRTREVHFDEPAARRGIFELGPITHLQSDVLGFFRRTRCWGPATTVWVRPRVLVPNAFSLGGVFDLEGLPSDQMSMSDLAFHSLREYVPGDDLRNVHWRSSAKAGALLVRQYLESRSLHAAFVVDNDPRSFADPEEFELAISVAASLALRALADGFEIDLACGTRVVSPVGPESLLDECCHYRLGTPDGDDAEPPVPVAQRAQQLARSSSSVGVGIVVSGSRGDLEQLMEASTAFGGDAQRITVRVDGGSEGAVRATHGVRALEIGRLEQLPRLTAWVTR